MVRTLAGLGLAGVFLAGLALGFGWRDSGRGQLVVDVQARQATVQLLDTNGDMIVDCPAATGLLKFTLPAGPYRLIVRGRDGERVNKGINLSANQSVVIQAPSEGTRNSSP